MKKLLIASFISFFTLGVQAEQSDLYFKVPFSAKEQKTEVKNGENSVLISETGFVCYLPSEDGYCTVPLEWNTPDGSYASLWREDVLVASGSSGKINATVRLDQSISYSVRASDLPQGKLLVGARFSIDSSQNTNKRVSLRKINLRCESLWSI